METVSHEVIAMLRRCLPRLEEDVTVLCEDGIRYTFCAPKSAFGFEVAHEYIKPSYGAGNLSRGAWYRHGFLWNVEQYVYDRERGRIVREMLSELHKVSPLPRDEGHSVNDVAPFIEDFGRALERLEEARKPKPKPQTNAKLQIKRIHGAWWLFHRQWMPLVFESFEEAAVFAKKYVVRRAS